MSGFDLTHYLRLSPIGGARIWREGVGVATEPPASEAPGAQDLLETVDGFPKRVLPLLRKHSAGAGVFFGFVRGSTVQSRLAVAKFRWKRLRDRLDFDSLTAKLTRELGEDLFSRTMSQLEISVAAKLLRHGDSLGPAKLVVRLATTDERALERFRLPEIEGFVDGLAKQAIGCTAATRKLFMRTRPEQGERLIGERLRRLVSRHCSGVSPNALEEAPQIFRHWSVPNMGLHPCLPITDAGVAAVAERMGVEQVTARTVIRLYRFCWLSIVEEPENLSDISLKCLAVLPLDKSGKCHGVVRSLSNVAQFAAESDPALQALNATRPAIRVGSLVHATFVPPPLLRKLLASDLPTDAISLPILHRIGGEYLDRFLGSESHSADEIVQIKVKRPCFVSSELDWKDVRPLQLSAKRIRRLIVKAARDGSGDALRKCAHLLGTLGRDDYSLNMRGVWAPQMEGSDPSAGDSAACH